MNWRGLKNSIEEVAKWADTRGMMGFENADQTNAIRANSFNIYDEKSHKFDDPKLVVFGGEAYLVENSKYVMNDDELQRYFITAISQHATYERILSTKITRSSYMIACILCFSPRRWNAPTNKLNPNILQKY